MYEAPYKQLLINDKWYTNNRTDSRTVTRRDTTPRVHPETSVNNDRRLLNKQKLIKQSSERTT